MKRFSILILIACLLLGCSPQYFLVVSEESTQVYTSSADESNPIVIPAYRGFVYSGKSSRKRIRYGNYNGYATTSYRWKKLATFSKRRFNELTFSELYGYVHPSIPIERYSKSNYNYTPTTGSSTSTKATKSAGGSVSVKGYTRKDGTYVRPHTRSAPRRH